MVSIVEMHSCGIIPIISAYYAFVLTDGLFKSSGGFSNICKPTGTAYHVDHMCDAQVMTLLMGNVLPVWGREK